MSTHVSLINKYNIPTPRYTSYPTVPYWDDATSYNIDWYAMVGRNLDEDSAQRNLAVYIHLPYCESMCSYCGCNTSITRNHAVEEPYMAALNKEWQMYMNVLNKKPTIQELHLGGGTPTFFSPVNLEKIVSSILNHVNIPSAARFSFEGHPGNTTEEHLSRLKKFGFTRLSLGIQDLDERVQKAIRRIQPIEQVERIVNAAKRSNYDSINFDLIYGLPYQTEYSIQDTVERVIALRPERIAFYSYAHVPWIKPVQRGFSETDLPTNEEKRRLYELGRSLFESAGYLEIGMDHFALPSDPLFKAKEENTLHRNFMGYTEKLCDVLIGLGASAISECLDGYCQNEKDTKAYLKGMQCDKNIQSRIHLKTNEDKCVHNYILDLMCSGRTKIGVTELEQAIFLRALKRLHDMIRDELVIEYEGELLVTPQGKALLRNICMAFDERFWKNQPKTRLFSSAI